MYVLGLVFGGAVARLRACWGGIVRRPGRGGTTASRGAFDYESDAKVQWVEKFGHSFPGESSTRLNLRHNRYLGRIFDF